MAKIKKQVTLRHIAKAANVSAATVSNVLNGKESVDTAIREKVLNASQQLHYARPSRHREQLATVTKMIAMISADVTDPINTLFFKGVENTAQLHRYYSILCDSRNSAEVEKEHVETLLKKGIEGLIIQPSGSELPCADLLSNGSCPCVVIDRVVSNVETSSVSSDNVEGAYQTVKYLLSLGHTNIMFIAGSENVSTARDRFQGYLKALEGNGIRFRNELKVSGNFDWDDSYQQVAEALRRKISFTAVFAANDTMALAAKEALERSGLRIPDDISIIGYNDIRYASAISLTTVAIDASDMGKNAMILLLDLISRRRESPHHVLMQPRLIIRNSCRKID
jgi:LacI family transcriptional regulator